MTRKEANRIIGLTSVGIPPTVINKLLIETALKDERLSFEARKSLDIALEKAGDMINSLIES